MADLFQSNASGRLCRLKLPYLAESDINSCRGPGIQRQKEHHLSGYSIEDLELIKKEKASLERDAWRSQPEDFSLL